VYQCSSANCETCFEGSCIECFYDDPECTTCQNGECADDDSMCTGECHDGCSEGRCVDDDYECNWRLCETCNYGECEDRCPALGQYCNNDTGMCEDCVIDSHCELCEECIHHECKHPCDDCVYPKYCALACFCLECNLGVDNIACLESEEENYKCPECSIQTIHPCSEYSMRDYTGTTIYTSCTGADCEPIEELCYTEYDCTTGDAKLLELCSRGDMAPPAPKACLINPDFPSWCWPCEKDSTDEGDPSIEDGYEDCPTEAWP
jgi:hypothetical protein